MTVTVFDEIVETADERFAKALAAYVATVTEVTAKHFADAGYTHASPTISVAKGGRKYAKVLRSDTAQTSVHSFVDKATGEIFKPAGWKAPAKHARGNIYDNAGVGALTYSGGILYLR